MSKTDAMPHTGDDTDADDSSSDVGYGEEEDPDVRDDADADDGRGGCAGSAADIDMDDDYGGGGGGDGTIRCVDLSLGDHAVADIDTSFAIEDGDELDAPEAVARIPAARRLLAVVETRSRADVLCGLPGRRIRACYDLLEVGRWLRRRPRAVRAHLMGSFGRCPLDDAQAASVLDHYGRLGDADADRAADDAPLPALEDAMAQIHGEISRSHPRLMEKIQTAVAAHRTSGCLDSAERIANAVVGVLSGLSEADFVALNDVLRSVPEHLSDAPIRAAMELFPGYSHDDIRALFEQAAARHRQGAATPQ